VAEEGRSVSKASVIRGGSARRKKVGAGGKSMVLEGARLLLWRKKGLNGSAKERR